MTDPDSRKTPARGGGQSRARKGGKAQSRRSPDSRNPAPSRRARAIQQARVLAMQVLYEDDLTDHSLDEILQHLGVQQRGELTAAYADVRHRANGIIETIDFLGRHAESGPDGAGLEGFTAASGKALASLSEPEDADDGDRADYVPPVQLRAEEITLPLLRAYRNAVAEEVKAAPAEPEVDDEALEVAEFEARLAALRGDAVPAVDEAGSEPLDTLARLRHEVAHQVSATLSNHERASRATMMEMVQRTSQLCHGVIEHRATIDATIEAAAPAYPIHQIASIDRSVLRVAVYELAHEPDVPFKVAVNEAVEIAKRYGGPNSGKFVNGVLRTIAKGLPTERTKSPAN